MSKILLMLLLLNSCSWNNNKKQIISKYVGKDESLLYETFGYPTTQFDISSSTKEIVYIDYYTDIFIDNKLEQNKNLPDFDYTDYYCKILFTITNRKITDYAFEGNSCLSGKEIG